VRKTGAHREACGRHVLLMCCQRVANVWQKHVSIEECARHVVRVRYCVLSGSQTQTRPLPRRRNWLSQSLAYVMNNCPHISQAASVAAHRSARARQCPYRLRPHGLRRNFSPCKQSAVACQPLLRRACAPSSFSSMLGTCPHVSAQTRAAPRAKSRTQMQHDGL
jgi:hypothetical protein